jgi:hypothetical protein
MRLVNMTQVPLYPRKKKPLPSDDVLFTTELRTTTMRNFTDICALVFGGGSSSIIQPYAIVKKALKRALQIQQGTLRSIMTVKYCWEQQAAENKSIHTQHYIPP